jgi:hypothetical protein
VGGVLGVGVLADRGDLAVADGEDADVAVVVCDVWGHLYDPMRTVGQVVADIPGLSTEIGHSRDVPPR